MHFSPPYFPSAAEAATPMVGEAAGARPALLRWHVWCLVCAYVFLSLPPAAFIVISLYALWGPLEAPLTGVSPPSTSPSPKQQELTAWPPSCPERSSLPSVSSLYSCVASLGGGSPRGPRAQVRVATRRPSRQLGLEQNCRVMLVRGSAPEAAINSSLIGSWYWVSRPEERAETFWRAPMFVNDRGMLLRREWGKTWRVTDAIFGGVAVAYLDTKQQFPNGIKWWIQQNQQPHQRHDEQHQQWERDRTLKAECLRTQDIEGPPHWGLLWSPSSWRSPLGGPPTPRDIFFGFQVAKMAKCYGDGESEKPRAGIQGTTSAPWVEGLHGESQMVCGTLAVLPRRAARMQHLLLFAARKVLEREGSERLLLRQPQHKSNRQERHQHREEQVPCPRLRLSGGVGAGAPGCMGTFSLLLPDGESHWGLKIYFSLSFHARLMFLLISDELIACGGEFAVPVAVGVGAGAGSSKWREDSTLFAADRTENRATPLQQQHPQQYQPHLCQIGGEVEVSAFWLQEGGAYVPSAMRLKCLDDRKRGTSTVNCKFTLLPNPSSVHGSLLPARSERLEFCVQVSCFKVSGLWVHAATNRRVCRDLRVRGFKIPMLNGVWRSKGNVSGRLHYVKSTTRIDVAVAGDLGVAANIAAVERREAGAHQRISAAKGLLHLYYSPKGLWVIGPRLPEESIRGTEIGTCAAEESVLRDSGINGDRGEIYGNTSADGDREALTAIAFARSDASEPRSGIWSVFRKETDRQTQRQRTGEELDIETNIVHFSCLGDVI